MAERTHIPGSAACGAVGDAAGGCAGRAAEARGRSDVYGAHGCLPGLRGSV